MRRLDPSGEQRPYQITRNADADISLRLKNLEFQDAYLCNSNGYQTANNVVYMWPKQVCLPLLGMHAQHTDAK